MRATDEQSLRRVALDNASLFLESGLTIALPLVRMKDKERIVRVVTLHQVLLKSKAEMDQFSHGLKALGVLDSLQQSPHLFRSYFTLDGVEPMTAGTLVHTCMRACMHMQQFFIAMYKVSHSVLKWIFRACY